jgi:hypothetical protein
MSFSGEAGRQIAHVDFGGTMLEVHAVFLTVVKSSPLSGAVVNRWGTFSRDAIAGEHAGDYQHAVATCTEGLFHNGHWTTSPTPSP